MKKLICILLVSGLSLTLMCSSVAVAVPVSYTEKDIQLDLSAMSGTVVYSMMYNIMSDPSQYMGQVIRIAGYYNVFENPALGMIYHSCVIPDATACCAQGMEFVWAGEHTYPNDYPQQGAVIIVTGKLDSYQEGADRYLHLVDAEMDILSP